MNRVRIGALGRRPLVVVGLSLVLWIALGAFVVLVIGRLQ